MSQFVANDDYLNGSKARERPLFPVQNESLPDLAGAVRASTRTEKAYTPTRAASATPSRDFLSAVSLHLAHRLLALRARGLLLIDVGHARDVQLRVRHLVGDRLVGKGCAQQLQRRVVGRVLRVLVRRLTYYATNGLVEHLDPACSGEQPQRSVFGHGTLRCSNRHLRQQRNVVLAGAIATQHMLVRIALRLQ